VESNGSKDYEKFAKPLATVTLFDNRTTTNGIALPMMVTFSNPI